MSYLNVTRPDELFKDERDVDARIKKYAEIMNQLTEEEAENMPDDLFDAFHRAAQKAAGLSDDELMSHIVRGATVTVEIAS